MRQRNTAFTLVELLVVIGIIAVLVGILLPALSRARAQGNTVKCMSNMRQLHTYTMLYATQFNNYCLPVNMGSGGSAWKPEYADWTGILARTYFKAEMEVNGTRLSGAAAFDAMDRSGIAKFLMCPSTQMPDYNPAVAYDATGQSTTPIKWTYLYNGGLGRYEGAGPTATSTQLAEWGVKKRNKVPNQVLTLVDLNPILPNGRGAFTGRWFHYGRDVNPLDSGWAGSGGYAGQPHGDPRKPKANVLLFDGSVRTIALSELNKKPNRYLIDSRDWAFDPTHGNYKGNTEGIHKNTVMSID